MPKLLCKFRINSFGGGVGLLNIIQLKWEQPSRIKNLSHSPKCTNYLQSDFFLMSPQYGKFNFRVVQKA